MPDPISSSTRPTLAEALKTSVLVFDGAMGTELYRRHVFTNRCYDELCLSDPKLVTAIHESYAKVGVDVLTTNTYGACPVMLEKYGLADKTRAINEAGVRLARQVAVDMSPNGTPLYVVGSIGPHVFLTRGRLSDEEIFKQLRLQIAALIEGGVDALIFESIPNRDIFEKSAEAMAPFDGFPFILSCSVDPRRETVRGESVRRLLAPLPDTLPSPMALGLNCSVGPDGILEATEEAMKFISLPLIVQPNAGMPKEFEGRQLYYCSPEYIATYAMRYVGLGAAAVGGCCGTTPDHLAEIVQMVKPLSRGRAAREVIKVVENEVREVPDSPLASRSRLAAKLTSGQWVTTVELTPPRGYDLTDILNKSRQMAAAGIDAVNLPDGPRASSRISSLVVAERILHETGIEPILHFCCRDRNLIGMQADLLGCAAYGIRNILFITGDPPKLGNYPHASAVFDTDSVGMCAVAHRLNHGIELGGGAITPPTDTVIGVGLDPTAIDQKREIERFRRKVDAGADFAITQPVFDPDRLLALLDEIQDCRVPVIAGVWPLASYRNALFMQNEVPGVVVPDATMARMEAASHGSREDQVKTGIEIARESVARVRGHVNGIEVSAPFGRLEISLAVIQS